MRFDLIDLRLVLLVAESARARVLLPRFSLLALVSVVVIAETGLLNATQHAATASTFLRSDYGSLVIAKAVLLGWLVLLGWQQRSRVIPTLGESGQITVKLLATLASWEFLLMGAAIAISVTMSRVGPTGEPTATSWVAPITLVLLSLALPLLLARVVRPSPDNAWVRTVQSAPEITAVVLAIVAIVVAGTGLLQRVVGDDWGAVLGALVLVLAGIPFAVALHGDRARTGVVAGMVAWVVIIGVTLRMGANHFGASPDLRVVAAALVLAEGLLWLALLLPQSRSLSPEITPNLVEA